MEFYQCLNKYEAVVRVLEFFSKKKKTKRSTGGKEAPYLAISTSQRHCHCHLPSGFRSSLSNVRGAFCSDREEENEKKNWRENRVQKI